MKVSFVIPARNEQDYIAECIASLMSQAVDFRDEIVVVDNGSIDATSRIASELGARVVYEPRAGLANARQAGFLAAEGDYLIYVDADSRLPAGWASDAVGLFEADDDLVALSSGFHFYDGGIAENVGNFVFRTVLNPAVNSLLKASGRPGVLIGSVIAVRAEALRRADGISDEFQFFGEDTALAYRLHPQGEVRFVGDLLVATSARRYQQRGVVLTALRYFSVFGLIHLGKVATASRLAKRFQDADRPGKGIVADPYGRRDVAPEIDGVSSLEST
jgi:glycosyltransferase involved in cell wall biosynthesis